MVLDIHYVFLMLPKVISALPLTLYVLLFSYIGSLVLGSTIAFIRIKRIPILFLLTSISLSFFRSIPNILNIMIIYYGLPLFAERIGFFIRWDKSTFCIVSLVLVHGHYIAEYMRPAWESVQQSMHDAAKSIGMTNWQRTRRIILPLAMPVALPMLVNAAIDMLKDTSVLFIIGLGDIMGKMNTLVALDYGVKKLEIYLAGGMIYAAIITSFTWLAKVIERRLKLS